MSDYKVVLDLMSGEKVWINPRHVVKMVKNLAGRYFIYLSNNEVYEVDHRKASTLENFLKSYNTNRDVVPKSENSPSLFAIWDLPSVKRQELSLQGNPNPYIYWIRNIYYKLVLI